MNDTDNGAPRAALDADLVPMRQLIALRLQIELFERALDQHREAVETLGQRQVNEIPLTNETAFRLNLIRDVLAVSTAFAALSVHANALLAAIENVVPVEACPS